MYRKPNDKLPTNSLYITGKDVRYNQESIINSLSVFGDIMHSDFERGKPFMFVTFNSSEIATSVIKEKNKMHFKLKMSYAKFLTRKDLKAIEISKSLLSIEDTKKTCDEPLPDGLILHKNFLSNDEEAKLVAIIYKMKWQTTIKRRRTQHYGSVFDYKRRRCSSKDESGAPVAPFPEWAIEISKKINLKMKDQYRGLNQLTINEYKV